jgi:hypothetical protein
MLYVVFSIYLHPIASGIHIFLVLGQSGSSKKLNYTFHHSTYNLNSGFVSICCHIFTRLLARILVTEISDADSKIIYVLLIDFYERQY